MEALEESNRSLGRELGMREMSVAAAEAEVGASAPVSALSFTYS